MHSFEFLEPATLDEAAQMLAEYGDESRVIAGGTALMLALRQRLLQPQCLISISDIEAMRGIDWDPITGLRIGALTLHSDVATSEAVRTHYPMLARLASQMANPQVRNQGTIGGNLCYGDPATDPPTGLLALDASVVLHSVRGIRTLPLSEFLVDYFTTAIEPDELLVEVRIPAPQAGQVSGYRRFLKTPAEHRPLAAVAVVANVEREQCREIRIAVGASTAVPMRLTRAELLLAGKAADQYLIETAAELVASDIEALDDSRGQEWYRRRMTKVIARDVIATVLNVKLNAGA